ncbi:Uncharacterized protein Fot_09784 [Forsythia ovata]|uniref:Uncharacterized protein n=1 Tax=Forsythia ovata TaxID=205694 RepID=A0ABD1WEY9_9LAMI
MAVDVKKQSGIMKSQCIKMIQRLIEYSEPADVAFLDYVQVKDLPDKLRLGYTNLVLAITDIDTPRASDRYAVCTSILLSIDTSIIYIYTSIFNRLREYNVGNEELMSN